jgi:hypothetical protein
MSVDRVIRQAKVVERQRRVTHVDEVLRGKCCAEKQQQLAGRGQRDGQAGDKGPSRLL